MKKQNRIAIINILSTVVLNGIAFFTAPLFSRLLGDSGYGVLNIYNIWVSALAIVFTLQTQGTLVNARVEYAPEQQDRYQSSAMGLSLTVFLVCGSAVLLFLKPVSGFLSLPPLLVALMLVHAFGTFCVNFFNTKLTYEFKAGTKMAVTLAITLSSLILAVILILNLPKESAYYGRILANAGVYSAVGFAACGYILLKGRRIYDRDFWKFCIVLAIPSVFYNLSDLLLGQSDRVMLQQMVGDSAVGQYSLALNFSNVMFVIFGALNHTWCPFFFEDKKQGRDDQLRAKAENFLELYTVLAMGFLLLSPEVYRVFASREFWPGAALIPVFVTSYYLNFLCTFPVNFEYYYKKTKIVAAVTISCALVNIGLNALLISRMGMMGAALATAISHSLQLLLHYGYCRYLLGKQDYPFGIRMWGKFLLGYFTVMAAGFVLDGMGVLRWGIGAAIGIAELLRIKKRKVLI